MRQGSSCRSWEPVRRATYSNSQPSYESSGLKEFSQNHNTTLKPNSCRPHARSWSSWTTDATSASNVKSSSDQYSKLNKLNSSFSSATAQSNAQSTNKSFDSIKGLPTRPKLPQNLEQNKQAHRSVEENRLRCVAKPASTAVNQPSLQLGRPTSSVEVNVARSRCHPRRRPCSDTVPAATPKLRRDTDCTDAIVRLIVFFSTKLVHTIWSQAAVTPKTSKDFNGAGVLPLQVFIQETLRRSKTSYSTLQVALFYLILLRPHVKPCQGTPQQSPPGCRALQCGRRMFLTALILASKYLQDRNYSARAWSKISGLPVAEINENERHYLELIKYNLHMSKATFENWSRIVLTICKASNQGPLGDRQHSPPSSPDGLSCSTDFERPGSPEWWSRHLERLTPDVVKDVKASEDYLGGLSVNATALAPSLSLDTPPSSPENLADILSDHSSPLVLSSSGSGPTPLASVESFALRQSPASVGSAPSRPFPPNLPTPQTTPRHDNAFNFPHKSSQTDLRCRTSIQALVGVEKQALNAANLETCPPPRPRHGGSGTTSSSGHPLRECTESSTSSWMSSPESQFSDSSSCTTRSRSSSVSSVSSLWSAPGLPSRQCDNKSASLVRMEQQPPCLPAQTQSRVNIGSYSFYHPVGNMQPIPENSKISAATSPDSEHDSVQRSATPDTVASTSPSTSNGELSDNQIAQLLASLSSQSDDQVHGRADPAAIRTSSEPASTPVKAGVSRTHKRSRSSKDETMLQDEVRQFLWNERLDVCVKDDKKPTTYVETADKEAQYPLQQWAHAKKPVPNALHTKRIALQHSSSEQSNASQLAADFLRQSVAVM